MSFILKTLKVASVVECWLTLKGYEKCLAELNKLKAVSQQWLNHSTASTHLYITTENNMSLGPACPIWELHWHAQLSFGVSWPLHLNFTGKNYALQFFKAGFLKILIGSNEKKTEGNFPCETLSRELLKFVSEDSYMRSFEQSEENEFLH